ncbi:MAG: chemotaxis protein CheA [Pirellulales bacterium]
MTQNGSASQAEVADDLLGDFLDEARQLLGRLNDNLVLLNRAVAEVPADSPIECDTSAINEMFRAAHSIKGLSGMLGFVQINQLTHKIENVFDAARRHELPITATVVDVVQEACDRLDVLVERLSESSLEEVFCDDIVARIAEVLQSAGADRPATSQSDAEFALLSPSAGESPNDAAGSLPAAASDPWPAAKIDHFDGVVDEQSPSKYLAIFIDEAELSIDSMNEVLLTEGGDPRAITETLLITSHRIKGSAASIGLHRPAKLAHLIEDILQDLREHSGGLSATLIDAILRCTDALRIYVQQLRSGSPQSDHFGQLADDLLAAHAPTSRNSPSKGNASAGGASAISPDGASGHGLTEDQCAAIARLAPDGAPVLCGVVSFEENLVLSGLKAKLLYEKLAQHGPVFFCEPAAESLDEIDELKSFAFAVATSAGEAELATKLHVAGVASVGLSAIRRAATSRANAPANKTPPKAAAGAAQTSAPRAAAAESAEGPSQAPRDASRPVETLRVDIDRLDQLMNLAGQLVINKARFARIGDGLRLATPTKQIDQIVDNVRAALEQIARDGESPSTVVRSEDESHAIRAQLRRVYADVETIQRELHKVTQLRASIADLGDAVHQLDRVADGIQKSVMDTRMVPVGPLFTRFKRVVRDITRANQKQVELVIRGEKTELDKRMIDELGDPLIHMVRNSADHGVELPDVRVAAGKPAQGTISLEAFHRGNSIVIRVSDDGKGLDVERIRAKAVEKGIVSQADADRLSDHQVFQLIWEPGFSTAEKVTEISGRGMGMDIVRSKIEQLNGTVDLTSRKGEGTTFSIKLPLTLAILPSLLVRIDGDVFALPLDAVVEIVTIDPQDIRRVHGRSTACVRNRVVSIVRLNELFDWRQGCRTTGDDSTRATLVVLGSEGREIGLVVDLPLGEEDIVIKSMAENYRNVAGVAGASILGDGRVSLILDPCALLDMSSRRKEAAGNAAAEMAAV